MHINVIDVTVYGILIISIAAGYYQGLLATGANTAGFFLSLLAAKLFYMGSALKVKAAGSAIPALLYYSETQDMLGSVDLYRTGVSGMTQQKFDGLMHGVNLPYPMQHWFEQNVLGSVYSGEGVKTLGDYLGHTIAETTVCIACFLIIFLIVYVCVTIAVNLFHFVVKLPMTRMFDGTLGAVVGLLRGVFLVYVLFMAAPAILSILPVHQITDLVSTSHTAAFYYQHNILFGLISGHIG